MGGNLCPWASGEDLEGVEGGEAIIKTYCIKNKITPTKRVKRKASLHWVFLLGIFISWEIILCDFIQVFFNPLYPELPW